MLSRCENVFRGRCPWTPVRGAPPPLTPLCAHHRCLETTTRAKNITHTQQKHHTLPHPWRVGCHRAGDTIGWHGDLISGEATWCCIVFFVVLLTSSAKMRFFWIPLSTMKCNGVPFNHICEWKRHSPSLGSVGSSGWIVVVVIVVVGYASMICLFSIFSGLDYESGFVSLSFISATNDCFERHSSMLFQGIFWKSHHFPVSFFIFLLTFFSCGLDWFSRGCLLGSSLS